MRTVRMIGVALSASAAAVVAACPPACTGTPHGTQFVALAPLGRCPDWAWVDPWATALCLTTAGLLGLLAAGPRQTSD